ncbi:MAG TPA: AAA family ATPase [Actinomycetota bacterium]|nr:AAA family ATPase [Actinomycetota bacterium]
MFVKGLRVVGFKSFADPTLLEFAPGVNVIVGPNGSGKSNIADAVQWVLGSQAPSSLRGGSMEDVIFAGSAGRPRLGIAEVELTLDNSERVLPLDLNEVTIMRSAGRDGSSEYRINGAPCRLLDVAELLSDTGIGRSIHTVVGQGQLDAVLQARPEDRRAFVEEAAQIGKFRRRKDRALRKIERVDDNLTRLNDVLTELRRAIRPLKRQAGVAARYSELLDEHRALRQGLVATEIHRLSRDEAAVDVEQEARRAELLSDELANVRARLGATAEERAALAAKSDAARSTAHRMARIVDSLAALARFADERAEKIEARLAAETEEGYRELIRLHEDAVRRWAPEVTARRREAERALELAASTSAESDLARARLDEVEGVLQAARADETVAAQSLVRAEGSEAAGRATLGSSHARVEAALERRHGAQAEIAAAAEEVAKAGREVEALERDLDAATERAADAETRLEAARARAENLRERLGVTHSQHAAADARLSALEEVVDLLADEPGVVGRLMPLVAEAQERTRLASANEDEARQILADADAEVERAWQEVATDDEELRKLDALVAGAAERLAGARRRREKREIELAALNEELARARDALATAERTAAEERAALPAHQAALEEARRAREDAEATVRATRSEAIRRAEKATDTEVMARTAEERARAARLRLEEAEAGVADARQALAGLESLRLTLSAARDHVVEMGALALAAARAGREWLGRAEANAENARIAAEDSERRVEELRTRERELVSGVEEVARRRNEAEVRRAQNEARIDALAERAMDEWGLTLTDLRALNALPSEEEEAARTRAEHLERDMRRLGTVNPKAAEEYAEHAERERFLEDQIEDLKSSRRDLMKVVREVDETVEKVFGAAFEDVAREFEHVFTRLFPGGEGKLRLTDPEDLLGSGIEVDARPPGKNVRKLSLLSGGERSLVALAFLFAIFRSRPSPFYLLDEVEAALDDINLQRFLGLIAELEERAQVLIVTHQKRTMEAGDVLYGVSMAKEGVSRVVAKKLEEVATAPA